jgi:hypothetical protein
MNFDFINELRILLDESNIFRYAITGTKALAILLLLFKLMETFISSSLNSDSQAPSMGQIINLFGYAFLIVSSDWIINSIEDIFAVVDTTINSTNDKNPYTEIISKSFDKYGSIWDGVDGVFDSMSFAITQAPGLIILLLGGLLGLLCMIGDMSLTCGYLLTRLFMVEVMKFVFPIVIALATLDITKDLFGRWIKKFIGLFVLGVLYLGIISFTNLVAVTLLNQFDLGKLDPTIESESPSSALIVYSTGGLIAMIVVFTTKIKLMAKATEFSNSFWS